MNSSGIESKRDNMSNGTSYSGQMEYSVLFGSLHLFLFISIAISNGLILLLIHNVPNRKQYRVFGFMFWLSVADLLVGLCAVLPAALEEYHGMRFEIPGPKFTCPLLRYAMLAAVVNAVLIKAGMSVDRVLFLRLSNPKLQLPWLSVNVIVSVSFILSLILASPQLSYWHHETNLLDGSGMCLLKTPDTKRGNPLYTLYFTSITFFLPISIMAASWGLISATLCHHGRESFRRMILSLFQRAPTSPIEESFAWPEPNTSANLYLETLKRAKKKATIMTLVTVLAYVLCWLPITVFQLTVTFQPNFMTPQSSMFSAMVVILMIFELNSLANPWIYIIFSASLRQAGRRLFCPKSGVVRRRPMLPRKKKVSSAEQPLKQPA